MSVREHVAFGLQAHGVAADEVERRVSTVLGRLGLAGAAERRPPELTLEERRRLAWRARSRPSRACCCWTSRSPISIR